MIDNAIAKYPRFTKLRIDHKNEILSVTNKFLPYSDFNFISLFSWNTNDRIEISVLNNNLVIKMPDYITEESIYSIIGDNKIDESLFKLMKITKKLKMVPEIVINSIKDTNRFDLSEERDHHDYIYHLESMHKLSGREFKWKRKRLNRSKRELEARTKIIHNSSIKESDAERFLGVFDQWAKERAKNKKEISQEYKAITNILNHSAHFNLLFSEILLDNQIIGFSINEVMANGYANCHFQKVLLNQKNIDILLTNEVAKLLINNGCQFVNWEQDLGIDGLRRLKSLYYPKLMLKKFAVSQKD